MSVYTPVTAEELAAWLTRYALGAVREFEPIATGIENTNYFLTTDKGRYVLTLYERMPAEELPFYLNLMAHLARAGVMAPEPEPDRSGALWSFLNGKPAGLVVRLKGSPVAHPDAAHCASVGRALAELHLAAKRYRGRLANRRGPAWWRQAARAVRPQLSAEQNALVASELRYQSGFAKARLPRGAIHGDLFCDNVLFVDGRVSGIIDFGFAATDALVYDLAITVNDWCVARDGEQPAALNGDNVRALVGSYHALRPLAFEERALWGPLLRAAALRFWLSRLYDLHLPRPGEITHAHDPAVFEQVLRHRIAREPGFPEL
jgi:homoserine kinase type II